MFLIKKTIQKKDEKKIHVLMTNGHSEILEIHDEKEANDLVNVMNDNADEHTSYELIDVNKKK